MAFLNDQKNLHHRHRDAETRGDLPQCYSSPGTGHDDIPELSPGKRLLYLLTDTTTGFFLLSKKSLWCKNTTWRWPLVRSRPEFPAFLSAALSQPKEQFAVSSVRIYLWTQSYHLRSAFSASFPRKIVMLAVGLVCLLPLGGSCASKSPQHLPALKRPPCPWSPDDLPRLLMVNVSRPG